MMDRLAAMIDAQLQLQRACNLDPLGMTMDERIAFIKDMVLATTDELHETLNEVGWKPWASSRHINEEAAFSELRDAWQFLTNLMLVVTQLSPTELASKLETELYRKHSINYARIGNYDGVSSKCPKCGRALDDPETKCEPDLGICVTG